MKYSKTYQQRERIFVNLIIQKKKTIEITMLYAYIL